MKIIKAVVNDIYVHGKNELPNEACGYLAGVGEVITHYYPMTNIDKSPEHFSLDPKEQFATIKQIRNAGLVLLSVCHTHPESPTRPSIEDIKLAYDPYIIYVIASLLGDKKIAAFRIQKNVVTNIGLEII